jgi:hypothetical protein
MPENINFEYIRIIYPVLVVFIFFLVLEIKTDYFKVRLRLQFPNEFKQITANIENFIRKNHSAIIEFSITGKTCNPEVYSEEYLYRIAGLDFEYKLKNISYITLEEIRILKFERKANSLLDECKVSVMSSYFPFKKQDKPNPDVKIFIYEEWSLIAKGNGSWTLHSFKNIQPFKTLSYSVIALMIFISWILYENFFN